MLINNKGTVKEGSTNNPSSAEQDNKKGIFKCTKNLLNDNNYNQDLIYEISYDDEYRVKILKSYYIYEFKTQEAHDNFYISEDIVCEDKYNENKTMKCENEYIDYSKENNDSWAIFIKDSFIMNNFKCE